MTGFTVKASYVLRGQNGCDSALVNHYYQQRYEKKGLSIVHWPITKTTDKCSDWLRDPQQTTHSARWTGNATKWTTEYNVWSIHTKTQKPCKPQSKTHGMVNDCEDGGTLYTIRMGNTPSTEYQNETRNKTNISTEQDACGYLVMLKVTIWIQHKCEYVTTVGEDLLPNKVTYPLWLWVLF